MKLNCECTEEIICEERDEYELWQISILKECLRVLKKDGSIFYNHKPRRVNKRLIFPTNWLNFFKINQVIIWDRGGHPNFFPWIFCQNTEYIIWIRKQKPWFNTKYYKYGEVWKINFKTNTEHPAPFPIEIPERCILSTTEENDIVLDPFVGSGTTCLAAKNLKRNYIGIDISKKYCQMADKLLKL